MKMLPEDLLAVVIAKDNGKQIEVRSLDETKWFAFFGSTFSLNREYRIKPEPVEPEQPAEKMTAYLLVSHGRLVGGSTSLNDAILKLERYKSRRACSNAKLVAVREI
jgi:hypothetical protein